MLRIEHELTALKLLSPHKNVIKYIESMHGRDHIYIVTEILPLDLFDFIESNHAKLNENIIAVITREIACALVHLHNHNICHLDIKPENLLLGKCSRLIYGSNFLYLLYSTESQVFKVVHCK